MRAFHESHFAKGVNPWARWHLSQLRIPSPVNSAHAQPRPARRAFSNAVSLVSALSSQIIAPERPFCFR